MAASSRSTRTFAGTRQLAAALVATLALALVLVAGIGTLAMTSRHRAEHRPPGRYHAPSAVAGSGSSASGDTTCVTPPRTFRDLSRHAGPPRAGIVASAGRYDPSMADADRPT